MVDPLPCRGKPAETRRDIHMLGSTIPGTCSVETQQRVNLTKGGKRRRDRPVTRAQCPTALAYEWLLGLIHRLSRYSSTRVELSTDHPRSLL